MEPINQGEKTKGASPALNQVGTTKQWHDGMLVKLLVVRNSMDDDSKEFDPLCKSFGLLVSDILNDDKEKFQKNLFNVSAIAFKLAEEFDDEETKDKLLNGSKELLALLPPVK